MSWHADPEALARYAGGRLDDTDALSVEAHLLACAQCRSAVARHVDGNRLDAVWAELTTALDAPAPSLVERLLLRLGVREHAARLLAATPSLTASWIGAVAVSLAFAVAAAHADRGGSILFLALAPLLPLAGIAGAYGSALDPAHELGLAAPMGSFRLLLIRATAVLGVTLTLIAFAGLLLPSLDARAAAWLLPAVGLALACLALGSYVSPARAAVAIGAAWVAAVAVAALADGDRFAAFGVEGQIASALLVAVAAAVLAARRDRFEIGGAA